MKQSEHFLIEVPDIHREQREIEESEYNELLKARQDILSIQQIEEHFNVILKSYEDFEQELLSISLKEITSPKNILVRSIADEMWSADMDILYLLNLRLISFLVTSISYESLLKDRIASIFGRHSDEYIEIQESINNRRKESWVYQLMMVLRNIGVHQGRLVNSISKGQNVVDQEKDLWKQTVHLRISIDEILDNERQLKEHEKLQTVLNELRESHTLLELIPQVRCHMDLVGRFHLEVRKTISEKTKIIDKKIRQALGGNDVVFIGKCDKEGVVLERTTLFIHPIKRRDLLVNKNHVLHRFSKQYVSGESPKLI